MKNVMQFSMQYLSLFISLNPLKRKCRSNMKIFEFFIVRMEKEGRKDKMKE